MAFEEHTSKKPDMKLSGNLLSPLKFSSLKYDMTWFVCFQKFIVSCCLLVSPFAPVKALCANLVIPDTLRGSETGAHRRRVAC